MKKFLFVISLVAVSFIGCNFNFTNVEEQNDDIIAEEVDEILVIERGKYYEKNIISNGCNSCIIFDRVQ